MLPVVAAFQLMAAASGTAGIDVFQILAQFGIAGVALFVLGLYAKNQTTRESARADAEREEVTRLNAVILEKVVPVLGEAAQAVKQSQQAVAETQRIIQDMHRLQTLAFERWAAQPGAAPPPSSPPPSGS